MSGSINNMLNDTPSLIGDPHSWAFSMDSHCSLCFCWIGLDIKFFIRNSGYRQPPKLRRQHQSSWSCSSAESQTTHLTYFPHSEARWQQPVLKRREPQWETRDAASNLILIRVDPDQRFVMSSSSLSSFSFPWSSSDLSRLLFSLSLFFLSSASSLCSWGKGDLCP